METTPHHPEGASAGHVAPSVRRRVTLGSNPVATMGRRGRLAQRESACFTRKRSLVRSQRRPPANVGRVRREFGGIRPSPAPTASHLMDRALPGWPRPSRTVSPCVAGSRSSAEQGVRWMTRRSVPPSSSSARSAATVGPHAPMPGCSRCPAQPGPLAADQAGAPPHRYPAHSVAGERPQRSHL